MAAAPGTPLTSDHVNYLIFRYLQESGHEKSATQFALDWHRPHEYHQPEDLPFAHSVHRSELVSVIQDGLAYDEIQARVGRNERRFRWTMGGSVGPRESVEEDGMAGETERENGSRPPSSGKRKGRAPPVGGMRAPDEFPTPAAKRQRVSHESDGPLLNGDRDAMEVDAASASPVDAASDANDEESATAESDFEVPAERYDSMDVATQTDVQTSKKTSTLSFAISKPGARILNASWCPGNAEADQTTLLTVGEDLCRYYDIPQLSNGDPKAIPHQDEPQLPPNSVITATAWHPNGRVATCAVDTVEELSGDKQVARQLLIDISQDTGAVTYPHDIPSLEPPGIITKIRYCRNGEYILVMRSNFKRSSIQIWQTQPDPETPQLRREVRAWRVYEHQVLDAAWQSDDSFVVCGEESLIRLYTLTQTTDTTQIDSTTSPPSAMHNLSEENIRMGNSTVASQFDSIERWDKICFEQHSSACIVAADDHNTLLYLTSTPDGTVATGVEILEHGGVEALAVAPKRASNLSDELISSEGNLWVAATATASGTCELRAIFPRGGHHRSGFVATLQLGVPAFAVAWSPDGKFVAAAGADVVKVWQIEFEDAPHAENNVVVDTRLLVAWRASDQGGMMDGNDNVEAIDEEEKSAEPCLSWSADGERLCFAVDKQVSIISFRPPLSSHTGEQVNGGASP